MNRPLCLATVGVVEINEAELPSTSQGEVWSSSTWEYLVVKGFESYTDKKDADEAVFQTGGRWL